MLLLSCWKMFPWDVVDNRYVDKIKRTKSQFKYFFLIWNLRNAKRQRSNWRSNLFQQTYTKLRKWKVTKMTNHKYETSAKNTFKVPENDQKQPYRVKVNQIWKIIVGIFPTNPVTTLFYLIWNIEKLQKKLQKKCYYAPPSRPEGPMRCPDRGNPGG